VGNETGDGPRRRTETNRVPEDVLLYGAQCEAQLDYILSVILGADDFARHLIEAHFVSRASRDRKLEALNAVMRQYCPDVADAAPYDALIAELRQLFTYRDKIAHSRPDHGDRYHRLRRHRGVNERITVTEEELAVELDRGMRCESALTFIPGYVRRPEPST
jgi:hypothetical protein